LTSSWVDCSQRIYIYCSLAGSSLVIIWKVYCKRAIWHSRWIDQKTIESIQIRASSLRAVNCRFWSTWETCFQEILHLSWAWEGKGWIRFQSNEHVVCIDIHVSWLVKRSQVIDTSSTSWWAAIVRWSWNWW